MSRFTSISRAPRRGQALLLAVLIMIFAALLSASFLVVVSVNLNQTARQADKNRAVVAARSGLTYVNHQLTYSSDGDKWFQKNFPATALTSLVGSGTYYSALDSAQGWAGSYAKFPDPRQVSQGDGPQFLAKVERIPMNLPATDPEFANVGALKITVIGLSPDDSTAYNRVVAYKGGYQRSPIAQVMRTVSNWDFKNNVVPVGVAAATTTTTLTVTSPKSDFSQIPVPFTVSISNPRAIPAIAARPAVVISAATASANTYTLTLATAASVVAGERVELAANLGAPATLNLSNSSTLAPVALDVNISDTNKDVNSTFTAGPNQVDGARVNGSLIYSGVLNALKLRPITSSFGTTGFVPGTVLASGVIASDSAATAKIDIVGGTNSDTLKSSDSSGVFATSNVANKEQLVSDNWNGLRGVPSANVSTRAVADFRPPNIASGEGIDRYRKLTRSSDPATGYSGQAALYGYGKGIYLDNAQDKERISTGATTYRDMTQAELTQMWLSKFPSTVATLPDFARTGIAITPAAPGSLEQKHLRGWVGPDEFRPRGVEIELGNDGTGAPIVTITRDARDDTTPLGASTATTWKDVSGNLLAGVYTRVLPWPTTGVIFAEGNVRLKGNALSVPNSLTVVSMGNIYIEDSVSADDSTDGIDVGTPRKLLLMAKKNVVMNPTRVLGRPDAQTTVTALSAIVPGPPTTQTLTVADGLSFKVGDYVQATTVVGLNTGQGIIVAPAPTATQINLSSVTGTVTAGDILRTPNGAGQLATSAAAPTKTFAFNSLSATTDVLQRRLFVPSSANAANLRLAFNHQGDRVPGLRVAIKAAPPYTILPNNVYFTNKGVLLPAATTVPYFDINAAVVAQGDKKLRGQFTEPSTGTDDFPSTAPTTEAEAQDVNRILGDGSTTGISAVMNSTSHVGADPMTNPGWQYDVSVLKPASAPTVPAFEGLPFYYLAGVGNRYSFGVTPTGDTRQDIKIAAYELPLANSIGLFLNGNATTVYDEHFNTTLANYDRTRQFGFSPTFLDPTTPLPIVPTEDVLTSDQGFYQSDLANTTLDSRSSYDQPTNTTGLVLGSTNTLVLRQSDGLLQPTLPATLPSYRLLDAKVENVSLTADTTTGAVTTTGVGAGYTFNVNAYVYAQTGSWFVIPGPLFDDRLVGSDDQNYMDLNGNGVPDLSPIAAEFLDADASGTWTAGDYADLNRNGAVDETEKHAMARYARFNYQINFTGAIAENQTALVNTIYDTTDPTKIVQPGAVDDWMTKWAVTLFPTPASGNPYSRIHYLFDPTYALGQLNDNPTTISVDETDYGFRLPQTSDLFYQD